MNCPREMEVVRALRSNEFTDELRTHASGCEACGEAMAVAAFCQSAGQPETVPDSRLLWRRMELRLRRERAEAAMRPAIMAERLTAAVLAVCGAMALPWLASQSPVLAYAAIAAVVLFGVSAVSVYWLAASKR
jgi:hypothetical protein